MSDTETNNRGSHNNNNLNNTITKESSMSSTSNNMDDDQSLRRDQQTEGKDTSGVAAAPQSPSPSTPSTTPPTTPPQMQQADAREHEDKDDANNEDQDDGRDADAKKDEDDDKGEGARVDEVKLDDQEIGSESPGRIGSNDDDGNDDKKEDEADQDDGANNSRGNGGGGSDDKGDDGDDDDGKTRAVVVAPAATSTAEAGAETDEDERDRKVPGLPRPPRAHTDSSDDEDLMQYADGTQDRMEDLNDMEKKPAATLPAVQRPSPIRRVQSEDPRNTFRKTRKIYSRRFHRRVSGDENSKVPGTAVAVGSMPEKSRFSKSSDSFAKPSQSFMRSSSLDASSVEDTSSEDGKMAALSDHSQRRFEQISKALEGEQSGHLSHDTSAHSGRSASYAVAPSGALSGKVAPTTAAVRPGAVAVGLRTEPEKPPVPAFASMPAALETASAEVEAAASKISGIPDPNRNRKPANIPRMTDFRYPGGIKEDVNSLTMPPTSDDSPQYWDTGSATNLNSKSSVDVGSTRHSVSTDDLLTVSTTDASAGMVTQVPGAGFAQRIGIVDDDDSVQTEIKPLEGEDRAAAEAAGISFDAATGLPTVVAEEAMTEEEMRETIRQEVRMENQRDSMVSVDLIVAEPISADFETEEEVFKRKRMWMCGLVTVMVLVVITVVSVLVALDANNSNASDQLRGSVQPTSTPSGMPSQVPSTAPSKAPTRKPSAQPSAFPSVAPSLSPSNVPTTSAIPSAEPTYSFEQSDEFFTILEVLAPTLTGPPSLIESSAFGIETSVPHQALDWMANSNHTDILAILDDYHQDNSTQLLQYYALVSLYVSAEGPNWTRQCNFLSDLNACDWNSNRNGVTCDEGGIITSLTFAFNRLKGTIDQSLYHLSNLQELSFSYETLRGTISSGISNLDQLSFLRLNNLEMDGDLPSEIGLLTKLEDLDISAAPFTGNIPTEFGELTSLRRLAIAGTELTGWIPSEVGNLTALTDMRMNTVPLDGPLPSTLGMLTELLSLEIGSTSVSGAIPTEVGELTKMTNLLFNNNKLDLPIPSTIGDMVGLRSIGLSNNRIIGSIPTELGELSLLTSLALQINTINGKIPSELGRLTNLNNLLLGNNRLSGNVPLEFKNMTRLSRVFMERNDLTGTVDPIFCTGAFAGVRGFAVAADCAGASPEVICTCCGFCV